MDCTQSSHLSSHKSFNHEGRWGTTDDFATSFLNFSLFSTALWDGGKEGEREETGSERVVMCLCVCACVHARARLTCVFACKFVCVCARASVCVSAGPSVIVSVCVCARARACVCLSVSAHQLVFVCAHAPVYDIRPRALALDFVCL